MADSYDSKLRVELVKPFDDVVDGDVRRRAGQHFRFLKNYGLEDVLYNRCGFTGARRTVDHRDVT